MVTANATKSGLLIPSLHQGIARNASQSDRPQDWPGLEELGIPSVNPPGGTRLRDLSGRGRHGDLTNIPAATAWVIDGQIGGYAVALGGVDDFIDILDTPALPGDLTIAIWVKPISTTDDRYISDFSGINEFALLSGFQDGFYNVFGEEGYPTGTASDSQIPMSGANIWDLVIWTKLGSNLKGYVNGVEQISVTISVGDFIPSAGWRIGRPYSTASNSYSGRIGQYRLYSRALTGTQVQEIYQDPLGVVRLKQRVFGKAPVVAGAHHRLGWGKGYMRQG